MFEGVYGKRKMAVKMVKPQASLLPPPPLPSLPFMQQCTLMLYAAATKFNNNYYNSNFNNENKLTANSYNNDKKKNL